MWDQNRSLYPAVKNVRQTLTMLFLPYNLITYLEGSKLPPILVETTYCQLPVPINIIYDTMDFKLSKNFLLQHLNPFQSVI